MAHCPSQDWDRYVAGEDASASAEMAFWQANKNRVLSIASAMLANPNVDPFKVPVSHLIEFAGKVVAHVMIEKCGEEY